MKTTQLTRTPSAAMASTTGFPYIYLAVPAKCAQLRAVTASDNTRESSLRVKPFFCSETCPQVRCLVTNTATTHHSPRMNRVAWGIWVLPIFIMHFHILPALHISSENLYVRLRTGGLGNQGQRKMRSGKNKTHRPYRSNLRPVTQLGRLNPFGGLFFWTFQ